MKVNLVDIVSLELVFFDLELNAFFFVVGTDGNLKLLPVVSNCFSVKCYKLWCHLC